MVDLYIGPGKAFDTENILLYAPMFLVAVQVPQALLQ
jgi:hypothetical protein